MTAKGAGPCRNHSFLLRGPKCWLTPIYNLYHRGLAECHRVFAVYRRVRRLRGMHRLTAVIRQKGRYSSTDWTDQTDQGN